LGDFNLWVNGQPILLPLPLPPTIALPVDARGDLPEIKAAEIDRLTIGCPSPANGPSA